MATDSEIRQKGYTALKKELGELDMERFIFLLTKDPFDYTLWQRNLELEKDVKTLSNEAMILKDKNNY